MNGDYTVYKHTTPSNKVYIGITSKCVNERWRKNGNGYFNNTYFYNAILKYGWDNIRHEILFTELTKEEAEQKEIELIAHYKSNQKEYGYNHAIGGGVNKGFHYSHTKEFKERVSKWMIGNHNMGNQKGCNNNFYGHKHTAKSKRLISLAQYKPVLQYNKQGVFVAEYSNCYQAQLQTGILHIRETCIGNRKTAGGYIWRYK